MVLHELILEAGDYLNVSVDLIWINANYKMTTTKIRIISLFGSFFFSQTDLSLLAYENPKKL